LIESYCHWELRRPFTQRSDDLNVIKDQFLAGYLQTLQHEAENWHKRFQPQFQFPQHSAAAPPQTPTPPTQPAARSPAALGAQPAPPSATQPRNLPFQAGTRTAQGGPEATRVISRGPAPDPQKFQAELTLAALVSAYFHIAAQRLVDLIPMILENELVRTFGDILFEHLEDRLEVVGPNSAEKCAAYIAEDLAIRRERQELQRKIRIFKKAKEKLRAKPQKV
jgi:Dynamin GTPase effector domain